MTLRKISLRVATAAILVAGLAYSAPALAQVADLAVRIPMTRTPFGLTTGAVPLGGVSAARVYVKNNGTVAATDVAVTLDTSAWPQDQVITGVSGCIPAAKPSPATYATNGAWFPCVYATNVGYPEVLTKTAIAAGAEKFVTISIKYGAALGKDDIYLVEGDAGFVAGQDTKRPGAWVCPAADRFAVVKASATTTTAETSTADNAAAQAAPPQALWADLEVTMTGPASVAQGATYDFPFTIKNLGPCEVSTDMAFDDSVLSGFIWKGATGICEGTDGDWNADQTDYQYCDAGTLAPDATATGTKTYQVPNLAKDLLSSNQGTGMQVTFGAGDFADPNSANDKGDKTYVMTQSAGCSTTGAANGLWLAGLGLAALLLKRRRTA